MQGKCEFCSERATSTYRTQRLVLDRDLELLEVQPVTHRVCMDHKAALMRYRELEREREIDRRYEYYSKWCDKLGYKAESRDKFVRDGRYKEW